MINIVAMSYNNDEIDKELTHHNHYTIITTP
jgi:hypothetical protein